MKPPLTPRFITFACGHRFETRIRHSGRAPCPPCQMEHKRAYERQIYDPHRKGVGA